MVILIVTWWLWCLFYCICWLYIAVFTALSWCCRCCCCCPCLCFPHPSTVCAAPLGHCYPAAVVCKSFFLRALEMIMKAENQRPIWQITRETPRSKRLLLRPRTTARADLDQAGSVSDEEATAGPGGLLAIGRIHFWWHSLSRSNWCMETGRVEWNFRRLNEDGQLDL